MKKRALGFVVVMAVTLAGGSAAFAAYRLTGAGVSVSTFSDGSGQAFGVPRLAMVDPNPNTFFGCSVWHESSGYSQGNCGADDGHGHSASCFTTDAETIRYMISMNADAYVGFTWNSAGECTALMVQTGSHSMRP